MSGGKVFLKALPDRHTFPSHFFPLHPPSLMHILFLQSNFATDSAAELIKRFSTEFYLLLAFCFIFGAIIGSFLNVVIHRLPNDESIVFPTSHCPGCNYKIRFYDNFPILSWLLLGGRCRSCQIGISFRYPLVEIATGAVFASFFWHDNLSLRLPFDCLFGAALIALIFIDAEQMILPNAITYPGAVSAFTARLILPLVTGVAVFEDLLSAPLAALAQPLWLKSLIGAAAGAFIGAGFLWLTGFLWKQLRGVDAMGLGDVKMMLLVGAYLGWRLTILTIFLAAFTGAVAGVILIRSKASQDYQTQIPFGIFLGLGALLSLLFGTQLIEWYLQNFIY